MHGLLKVKWRRGRLLFVMNLSCFVIVFIFVPLVWRGANTLAHSLVEFAPSTIEKNKYILKKLTTEDYATVVSIQYL